jgi:DNA-binding NarL/FixJ family response regulator
MDFTERLKQLRQNTEASNGLLEGTRLVVAMGSRLALSLFVSAIRPGAQLVGAVTGEAEALQRLERHQADLLLCTDQLEQGNGGSLVAAAKRLSPQLRTLLIVTQPRRTAQIEQALQAGCDGLCLESNIGMGTVLQALTCVDLGAAYIDRDLRPSQLQGWAGLDGQPLTPLTPREREVLTLMSHSLNNQEIAQRLVISPETAKTHVQRILTKLQARDRLQAVLQGIRLGLVEWPEPR